MFEPIDEPESVGPPDTRWLYAAADRIAAGDDESIVMANFGYERRETT